MKSRAKAKPHGNAAERLKALQDISVELMGSRHLRDTLAMIVNRAVDLFVCDGGSIYLQESEKDLVFEVAVNRSIEFHFEKSLIPISSKGLAAYVFRTGKELILKDVYGLAKHEPYQFDSTFDKKVKYRTRSVLIQPMRSTKGEILGVIQVVNRKSEPDTRWSKLSEEEIATMPEFTNDDSRLLQSFAAVASAAIENAKLYKNIENLFEGFVTASIHAIEARDASTRGHSERVAILTVDLAEKVSRVENGVLRAVHFSDQQIAELRYAALLHDFGKIGVREATLLKEEKLSEAQKTRIRARFTEFKQSVELKLLKDYIREISAEKRHPSEFELTQIERATRDFSDTIDQYWEVILELNRPTVMNKDKSSLLNELTKVSCLNCQGQKEPLLLQEEASSLAIIKGSLSPAERQEIQSHVTHTFEFLRKIPWTRELRSVPDIAHAHHERLDGSGYPRGVKASEIPTQSKIMAICDIYDALVTSDRPYKAAVPVPRALDILELEAKEGAIDRDLLKVFREAKIYEHPDFLKLMGPGKKRAA